MLKLTKSVSAENYPLTPERSSVRRLTLTVQPSNPVDLAKSYLLVKNTISTTLRGGQGVVRNVGWGTQLTEDKVVMYPNTCQIRTAALYLDGQMVEYCEDLDVRVCNLTGYEKSVDELRKLANVGKYGFQRVEGARIGQLDGTATPRMDGCYLSPFLERPIAADGSMGAARYKEVANVIHLSDIFGFCAAAGQVNLAGRTVKVELQFEDRFELLTEAINYPADCSAAAPTTINGLTFPLLPLTIRTPVSQSDAPVLPAVGDAAFSINSVQKFKSVAEVPFYVGQPICLWLNGVAPVAGSNYAVITGITLDTAAVLPANLNQAVITFGQYNIGGEIINAGGAITDAQFFANIVAAGAGVCVGMSGVYDPVQDAGNDDILQFNNGAVPPNIVILGAGLATNYQITGLEAVMCELIGQEVGKKSVDYVQYSRDLDTIASGQLYYQKSFMLDPGCAALFAVAPCTKLHGQPNRNMYSISEQVDVVSGQSFRNMLNGVQLYSRDITFSDATQNTEPLHLDRLEMAYEALDSTLKNTNTTTQLIHQNGTGQHLLLAEHIPVSGDMQQFQVRLNHEMNDDPRTIYVFKAIVKSANV